MEDPKYKYDVAFSFLAQDEALASELNGLISDRFQTFLYSKEQEAVAGTDGEITLNAVFGEEARMVVVLYRNGWGETPWTRIEQTAIRNRAYENGYDFVKFLRIDDASDMPKWLPKAQIWIGFNRWGVKGAASVIEARIEELGGEPHEETATDRAARLDRSLKFQEKRKQILGSEEGVKAANAEFENLCKELDQLQNAINKSTSSFSLNLKRARDQIVIRCLGYGLNIEWNCFFRNSLDKARLDLSVWRGHPPFPGVDNFFDKPTRLRIQHFIFDLLPNEQHCWTSSGPQAQAFTTIQLASIALKSLMDQVEQKKSPSGPMVY